MKTDADFLREAYVEACKSGDLSTQNGAVLVRHSEVIARGRNDIFPPLLDTPERRQRPAKYEWTEHAERAVIYNAARRGVATNGAWLYCPWSACADCGRAIVLAGIIRVITHDIPQHRARPDWEASISVAMQMFKEVGIEVVRIREMLGVTFRFGGELIAV